MPIPRPSTPRCRLRRDPQFAVLPQPSYKTSFSKKSDALVVDPNGTEFFRAFRNGGTGGGAAPAPAAGPRH
jgi:membrane protease subunit HflC